MELIEVYKCLCDLTRLRILHLLTRGPQCVCQFQNVLALSQVQISKHLAYLRRHNMVETQKRGTWVYYSLPERPSHELEVNLRCLQDCCRENPLFSADLQRLDASCPSTESARTQPKNCCS